MSEEKTFLYRIFKKENFKQEELELVISQFNRYEFKKNERIISRGDITNYYYFLEEGFIRSYAIDLDGNDITTTFYSSKDIVIDWQSFFLKTPCREDIQALSKCVCWKITFTDFMKLFHIESFREVGRTRLVNSYFNLKGHSTSIISDQAKDRYLKLMEDKPDLINNVPLKHIATYLGITDTSLSRIRKEILANS